MLSKLRQVQEEELNWKDEVKELFKSDKKLMKKGMAFANFKL